MALVASGCSLLTWFFRAWELSPLCSVACASFPFALHSPPDLKHVFSLLLDLALKWSHDEPSGPSRCKPESDTSSSLPFFEARDSCDLYRPNPLKSVLKWEVKGLSESSFFSWEPFSFEDFESTEGCGLMSVSSGSSKGESYWEITIDGRVWLGTSEALWFSKDWAVDSSCRDDIVFSSGAPGCMLEFCKVNKTKQSLCEGCPWGTGLSDCTQRQSWD